MKRTGWMASFTAGVSWLGLLAIAAAASAGDIKVFAPVGLRPAIVELAPAFERASDHKVSVEYGTVAAVADRVQKGDSADVAIATPPQMANLAKQGTIVEGSIVDIARQGIGVLVRTGAAKPDISSVDAFKRALLAAQSIGHADPARGGGTAVYVAGLLARMDIAAELKPKIRYFQPGVYDSVAQGEIQLAFGGITEILAAPGVDLVGPLPAAVQDYTTFTAGVLANSNEQPAGRAFIDFIAAPGARAILKAKGYD